MKLRSLRSLFGWHSIFGILFLIAGILMIIQSFRLDMITLAFAGAINMVAGVVWLILVAFAKIFKKNS